MNGLQLAGFRVYKVLRKLFNSLDDIIFRKHLCLLWTLETQYIPDVNFGFLVRVIMVDYLFNFTEIDHSGVMYTMRIVNPRTIVYNKFSLLYFILDG